MAPGRRSRKPRPNSSMSIVAQLPLGKMTTGEDMARTIAFAVSPACMTMTGANIVVDSGMTKRVQF